MPASRVEPRPDILLHPPAALQRSRRELEARVGIGILTIFPSPYPVGPLQPGGRVGLGQPGEDVAECAGRRTGGACASEQFDDFDAKRSQRADHTLAAVIPRHQHGDGGVGVFGQPGGQRVDHKTQLLFWRELPVHELDAGGVIGRVRLGSPGGVGSISGGVRASRSAATG